VGWWFALGAISLVGGCWAVVLGRRRGWIEPWQVVALFLVGTVLGAAVVLVLVSAVVVVFAMTDRNDRGSS
jgi:hypothetical protein